MFLVRPLARMALAAATTVVVTVSLTGVAQADPKSRPTEVPSQAQVDRAQAEVATKKKGVTELEVALAAAMARMETASVEAEAAAERYNGARWRLEEARKAARQAQLRARQAVENVDRQREGIVSLVTDSYQNGTELNTATAMMSDEGPEGLMNRYGVVSSAGDSMEARYDAFRTASTRAKRYAAQAATAQERQQVLAADAKQLAVVAGQAAAAAGAAANQISDHRQQLLRAVAKAENISVELAGQRHDALEQIAQRKVAAAAAAKAAAKETAEQTVLVEAATEAKKQAAAATPRRPKTSRQSSDGGSRPIAVPAPAPAPAPVANPAPNQKTAVQRAIAYAKRQLGRPYQWGATGPSTFDCSGLTMQAWARGGVSLPHYSVAQFARSTRVSMSDARAGDLLFWSNNGSPGGIHHVAIYLGGGQFIEAPRTGLNVRYNSIYTWYPDFVARP